MMTLINSTNVTSSVSAVTIDNVFDDSFSIYKVIVTSFRWSHDNRNLMFRVIHDDGATNTASDYRFANYYYYSEGSYVNQRNNGTSNGLYHGYGTSAQGSAMEMTCYGFRTDKHKYTIANGSSLYKGTYTYNYNMNLSGCITDTRKIRGLYIHNSASGVNLVLAKIRIYGVV